MQRTRVPQAGSHRKRWPSQVRKDQECLIKGQFTKVAGCQESTWVGALPWVLP